MLANDASSLLRPGAKASYARLDEVAGLDRNELTFYRRSTVDAPEAQAKDPCAAQ
jgi:hypothetical protein